MRKAFLLVAVSLGVIDPTCTLEKICQKGYTKTVRPPNSYTRKLKQKQLHDLGLNEDAALYEEDHIMPLELCGAPSDPNNLTPELWETARRKDVLETRFHRLVCRGEMTLEEAQRQIVAYE